MVYDCMVLKIARRKAANWSHPNLYWSLLSMKSKPKQGWTCNSPSVNSPPLGHLPDIGWLQLSASYPQGTLMDHAVDGTWYEWPYHFNQWKCSWPNWAFTETFIHLFSSSKVNLIAWGSKVCQVLWFQMRHGVLLCRDQWDSEDGMWDSQLKKKTWHSS